MFIRPLRASTGARRVTTAMVVAAAMLVCAACKPRKKSTDAAPDASSSAATNPAASNAGPGASASSAKGGLVGVDLSDGGGKLKGMSLKAPSAPKKTSPVGPDMVMVRFADFDIQVASHKMDAAMIKKSTRVTAEAIKGQVVYSTDTPTEVAYQMTSTMSGKTTTQYVIWLIKTVGNDKFFCTGAGEDDAARERIKTICETLDRG